MFIGIGNAVTRGENVWGPLGLFANGDGGASWDVLGFSTIGEAIASITDSSGNDISLANAVTAQQPAYDETEDGIKYAFFDLDDSLSATLPDLGADASKWTVTPYAVHIETGQTIGAGSYTAPTNDWGAHGVIDREVTATEINRLVAWAKSRKLTGVDYPTLKTRMDVICMNAVDVFVYDTTQDSDGGTWRNDAAAQASSWYNETLNTATRGSRREFPEMAVIVAESNKVTIYDATDPALPMWMVFTAGLGVVAYLSRGSGGEVTGATAQNGIVAAASRGAVSSVAYDGLCLFNFVADTAERYSGAGAGYVNPASGLADRNDQGYPSPTNADRVLVSNQVNSVAMTVLPGDTEPTIAVATDGGVSVIKDDGTVVDWTPTGDGTVKNIHIDAGGIVTSTGGGIAWKFFFLDEIPASDSSAAPSFTFNQTSTPARMGFDSNAGAAEVVKTNSVFALPSPDGSGQKGLNLLSINRDMVAYTTSTYNTGWMVGDVKGCWLCDTDDSDLVGATLTEDFTTYADQAAAEAAGWSFIGTSFDAGLDAIVFSGTGSANATLYGTMIADAGITGAYEVTVVVSGVTAGSISVQDNFVTIGSLAANGTYVFRGVRAGSFRFVTGNSFDGEIESVTFKALDYDRSVNNNGLIVNGTITREPVAEGAELVAYSGFSSSNYLEQPYNADLDFGTGDFCFMWWGQSGNASDVFFDRYNGSGNRIIAYLTGAGYLSVTNGSETFTGSVNYADGVRRFFVVTRKSGTLYVYVNGQLVGSTVFSSSVDTPSPLVLGQYYTHAAGGSLTNGSLALLRISGTAPSAAQIAKIYEDELPLFQEKAACTLNGASDAVTALTHDLDTGVLRAAQSDKTSLFLGLERVGEEDGKATCIASSNGIVAGI